MIVTPLPCGRMGNRISFAAHFIAHVEEHGGTYLNLAFQPYNRFFEGTRGKLFLRYASSKGRKPDGAPRWRRPFAVRTDGWFKRDVDMRSPEFLDLERRASILFCGIWLFRDKEAFQKHADTIRRFFRPVAKWRAPAEACVASAREGADRLVAVHMRLTDYAKFNGGAWFYAPADYRRWMEQTAALHAEHTRFLLFSDKTIPEEAFAGIDWRPGPIHPVSAQHAMSLCDAILGPPSTFSGWASFMGRVPRLPIRSRDEVVRKEDFVAPGT